MKDETVATQGDVGFLFWMNIGAISLVSLLSWVAGSRMNELQEKFDGLAGNQKELSDTIQDLGEISRMTFQLVDAQKARIDALERAMAEKVVHGEPNVYPFHMPKGTQVPTNDYGVVYNVPAISPSAVWPIALPTP